MKELISYYDIDIKDIPKVFSYEYFNMAYERYEDRNILRKFKRLIDDKIYKSLFEYINEVYPNTFKEREFPYKNHYITLDNIIVRSEPERVIHHYLMRNKLNYKYGDIVGKINIDGVNVLPDWYIYKDDITYIVEYYGMLDMYGVDFGYNDKYEKKTKLYDGLCKGNSKYRYIAIYKDDLKYNLQGLKDKLIEYGIIK